MTITWIWLAGGLFTGGVLRATTGDEAPKGFKETTVLLVLWPVLLGMFVGAFAKELVKEKKG